MSLVNQGKYVPRRTPFKSLLKGLKLLFNEPDTIKINL